MDYLHKYLVLNKEARVITVSCKDTVDEYLSLAKPTAASSAAMGRLIAASLMMGSMLKGKEKVMVSIEGNGPIGPIKAEADSDGNVRAFATNPMADAPLKSNGQLNVSGVVGCEGFLYVRKQLNMKEPFIGSCELISGEIGEDISYYFGTSEQTPSIVALGVTINPDLTCKIAGGFIIQLLPKASEETYQFVESLLTKITSVSKLIEDARTSDKIISQIFDDAELILENPVQFKCNCSKERTTALLTQLSNEELDEDIKANKGLDVTCNFCSKVYHFDTLELMQVKELKKQDKYKVK